MCQLLSRNTTDDLPCTSRGDIKSGAFAWADIVRDNERTAKPRWLRVRRRDIVAQVRTRIGARPSDFIATSGSTLDVLDPLFRSRVTTAMPSDQSTWLIAVPNDGDSVGVVPEIATKLSAQSKTLPRKNVAQFSIPAFKVRIVAF
jgi:hypothetical protein